MTLVDTPTLTEADAPEPAPVDMTVDRLAAILSAIPIGTPVRATRYGWKEGDRIEAVNIVHDTDGGMSVVLVTD